MKCKDFVDHICDYLEGNLSEAERATFEKCLESDPCCQRYFASYQLALRLGQSVCQCPKTNPESPLPEDIVSSILDATKEK